MPKGREIRDYTDLHLTLRERAAELGVSRLTLDEVSGLQSGYASKLLAVPPMKHLGPMSFGLMLQALGLKLIAVEDPQALAKVSNRLVPRARSDNRSAIIDRIVDERLSKILSENGRRGGLARKRSLTKAQRIAISRLGNKARRAAKKSEG